MSDDKNKLNNTSYSKQINLGNLTKELLEKASETQNFSNKKTLSPASAPSLKRAKK